MSSSSVIPTSDSPSSAGSYSGHTVEAQIAAIYSAASQQDSLPVMDQATYLDIYTGIYQSLTGKGKTNQLLTPETLYRSLERDIRSYCQTIRPRIYSASETTHESTSGRLLRAYMAQWDKLLQLAGLVNNLLRFFERHWIRRMISEKHKDIYLIRDLHILIWKEQVLQVGVQAESAKRGLREVVNAVSVLQTSSGGEDESWNLVKAVLKSFSSLGLTLEDGY